jgi:hypothetical protein
VVVVLVVEVVDQGGGCVVVVVLLVVVVVVVFASVVGSAGIEDVCGIVFVVIVVRVRVVDSVVLMAGVTDAIVSIVRVGVGEAPLRLAVGKGCEAASGADDEVLPLKMASAVDATAATVRRPTAPRTATGAVRMLRASWTLSGSPMLGRPSGAACRRGRPVDSWALWLGSVTRLTSRVPCSEGERCVRSWFVRAQAHRNRTLSLNDSESP